VSDEPGVHDTELTDEPPWGSYVTVNVLIVTDKALDVDVAVVELRLVVATAVMLYVPAASADVLQRQIPVVGDASHVFPEAVPLAKS
jgi:hypothetical protein